MLNIYSSAILFYFYTWEEVQTDESSHTVIVQSQKKTKRALRSFSFCSSLIVFFYIKDIGNLMKWCSAHSSNKATFLTFFPIFLKSLACQTETADLWLDWTYISFSSRHTNMSKKRIVKMYRFFYSLKITWGKEMRYHFPHLISTQVFLVFAQIKNGFTLYEQDDVPRKVA